MISSAPDNGKPLVVIAGRPNVGKSTLFNRLIRKRKAITDPTPGVTRDPVYAEWSLLGNPLTLVDTGGVKLEQAGLDSLVTGKSYAMLEKADLVILMVDATEVTPEDEDLIERMRPYSDKVLVAVNKVDTPARDVLVYEFYSFGFTHVLGISSEHGLGIGELEDAVIELLGITEAPYEQQDIPAAEGSDESGESLPAGTADNPIRIAVMGKPNTGKSTLVNLLTGTDGSIVSDIPGTTRDVVTGHFTYRGTHYRILDTAGIRRKKRVGENVEFYSVNRAIRSIDEAHIILIMVDSTEGLSEQDKKIASMIVGKGKGAVLVLNKWDLIRDIPNQLEAVKDRTRFVFPILNFAPLVPISALEGDGAEKLLDTVWAVWRQLNRRVDTGRFNKALKDWLEQYQIPRGSRTYYKILYGTQTSANPVHFLLFVNHVKGFPKGYLQYVKNRIRKDLGFTSVPLEIHLRERRS